MMPSARDRVITGSSWFCGMLLLAIVSCIIGYLLYRGFGSLNLKLIFGETDPVDALLLRKQVFDGLLPAMIGTFLLVLLSVSFAVPVGLAAGIYMAEYCRGNIKKFFNLFFDILAGLPSIVIGLFGFSVAVFLHHHFSENIYPCLLISALSLAFLVLPYLIRATQVSLEGLSENLRITAPALGATKLQNIVYVLVPRSFAGILSGVILSIGRCAEDTAVIMLTGVVATAGMPKSILSNYEALPFYIYYISSQYMNKQELLSGFGAAIILLAICVLLFGITFFIKHRLAQHFLYR